MFISNCLRTNQENHLEIGGCDAVALAKEYGTPLYVMDETCIRENCRLYTQAMKKYYNNNGLIPVSYTHLDVYKRQARCWSP